MIVALALAMIGGTASFDAFGMVRAALAPLATDPGLEAVVKLEFTKGDAGSSICTGTFVSDRHVITAEGRFPGAQCTCMERSLGRRRASEETLYFLPRGAASRNCSEFQGVSATSSGRWCAMSEALYDTL